MMKRLYSFKPLTYGRGIVSVRGASLLYKRVFQLDYDIVHDGVFHSRILIIPGLGFDHVYIDVVDRGLRVRTVDDEYGFEGYVYIPLKHRVKRVEYRVRNGVITVKVRYKRFFFL
jgi:hypothetical protein